MSLLYVDDDRAVIGIDANRFYVKYEDGMRAYIPEETLDSITITGRPQMTTQCIQECLKKGIPVSFFSKGGRYFGRLHSTGHVNVERQRLQCELYNDEFSVEFSKQIIKAKIRNQCVVLRRYEKSRGIEESDYIKMMKICRSKIDTSDSIEVVIKGLNPYFGFMHRDSEKHPTLASDLMEEWRATIVDATVVSLINSREIRMETAERSKIRK